MLARAWSTSSRACGVVAIDRGCVSDAQGAALRDALRAKLSRCSPRGDLRPRSSARGRWLPLRALRDAVANVSLLAAGAVYRERDDARIDLTLDAAERSALLPNPFLAAPCCGGLLRAAARLRPRRTASSRSRRARAQHWHRDTGLLFADDDDFHLEGVHAARRGVHLPPCALNAFIHLEDLGRAPWRDRVRPRLAPVGHALGRGRGRRRRGAGRGARVPARGRACVGRRLSHDPPRPGRDGGRRPALPRDARVRPFVVGRRHQLRARRLRRLPRRRRARATSATRARDADDEPVDGDGDDAAASAARWRMYWGS